MAVVALLFGQRSFEDHPSVTAAIRKQTKFSSGTIFSDREGIRNVDQSSTIFTCILTYST